MRRILISWGALYLLGALLSFLLLLFQHDGQLGTAVADTFPVILFVLHVLTACIFFLASLGGNAKLDSRSMARALNRRRLRFEGKKADFDIPMDGLFAISLTVFLFSYIFALAANMDYVQRFIQSGGNFALAVDSKSERMLVLFKYGTYLLIYPVARGLELLTAVKSARIVVWRKIADVCLVICSALLHVLAFPSGLFVNGLGPLAWFAFVPLLIVLRRSGFSRWMFHAFVWTMISLLVRNYWLGTFNLVSLQVAAGILGLYSMVFFFLMYFVNWGLRRLEASAPDNKSSHVLLFVLLFSCLWTIFDWIHSRGFTAYPWTLLPHSQWKNLPLMQITGVTGIWGISFVLYGLNCTLASFFVFDFRYRRVRAMAAAVVATIVFLLHMGGLAILLQRGKAEAKTSAEVHADVGRGNIDIKHKSSEGPVEGYARIALVQQNTDPRKHSHEQSFQSLRVLGDAVVEAAPETDLVVWSENAFIPNIRRWSMEVENPGHPYARLVNRMLEYQRSLGTWLLTGNDDYDRILDENGKEIDRLSYNAAVLFADDGQRRGTYRKLKLVPFTESFPFKDELPGIYGLLQDFDVNFEEPGKERSVFVHPKFGFSSPICFEDTFPDEVRKFVNKGAELIVNISNDYWSLSEVAARQHFAAAIFRATENRRYLLRSSTGGMTAAVDPYGRIIAELPAFTASAIAVDIPTNRQLQRTVYSVWGDWFILLLAIISAMLLLGLCAGNPRRS